MGDWIDDLLDGDKDLSYLHGWIETYIDYTSFGDEEKKRILAEYMDMTEEELLKIKLRMEGHMLNPFINGGNYSATQKFIYWDL